MTDAENQNKDDGLDEDNDLIELQDGAGTVQVI